MLCPVCYGRHFILVQGRQVPCPECQGFGELHCCDGLTEQPDSGDTLHEPDGPSGETDLTEQPDSGDTLHEL